MTKQTFEVQELESRFEMEIVAMPDGTMIDTSGAEMEATKGSCSCTSTCSPF